MTTNETRQYTMLMRVREFGEAHPDVSSHSSVAEELFAAVASAVTELSEHDVTKMSAARQGSAPGAAARRALVERLGAIGRTARAMARDTPGLLTQPDTVFQIGVPPSRVDILSGISGVDFGGAWSRRMTVLVHGQVLAVLSREDFIANKRAAGRPKDLLDLALLDEADSH